MLEIIQPETNASNASEKDRLTVALAQIAPVWIDRNATIEKVASVIHQAADEQASLVAFSEALIPGYPFWVERTDGARFESDVQKEWYSHYLDQGVRIESGDLDPICDAAKQRNIAVYVGVMERAIDRGGHTLYCSLVYIDRKGIVGSVHRKLQPTYDERLVWGMGDGHGLRTHPLDAFTVGGLNCWENWLPLARAALYGQGENLHVAVWPGGPHNTEKLTPVIAMEGRSYALSVSGIMTADFVSNHLPFADQVCNKDGEMMARGGSCIAAPDGSWVIPPVNDKEALLVATVDHAEVRKARHSLDVAGHYSRPDVVQLRVNRERMSTIKFMDE